MPLKPAVYIVSDSLGETADQVVKAALSQFDSDVFRVIRMPKISSASQVRALLTAAEDEGPVIFFYTFADPELRDEMARVAEEEGVQAIDIIGPGIVALEKVSGISPAWMSGMIRKTDRDYFHRVEALEFAVKHDDGRGAEDLDEAEIVLIGVSRSGKTPLSMYLAFKGYKVANIPLVTGMDAPPELFEVDSRRVFGLVTDAQLLAEIRGQRVRDLGGYTRHYAEPQFVDRELDTARSVMKRIGCMVVHTEDRAIEETAQEVLRHLDDAFPS
jgi:[pyruvate, water dikinase]-phosphate phosphotransferase / [pyruvate, water dikinase] kinase